MTAIYLDVKQYLADQRQGTHKSKQRNEVAGSTRKLKRMSERHRRRPLRQHQVPLFRAAGRVFGPSPRLQLQLNKKLKQLARRSALTYKAQAGAISVVETLSLDAPKIDQGCCGFGRRTRKLQTKVLVLPESTPIFSFVPQPALRTARAGSERLHLRRDERIGDRDGGRCRECFEYDVSQNARHTMEIIIKPVLTEK